MNRTIEPPTEPGVSWFQDEASSQGILGEVLMTNRPVTVLWTNIDRLGQNSGPVDRVQSVLQLGQGFYHRAWEGQGEPDEAPHLRSTRQKRGNRWSLDGRKATQVFRKSV